MSESATSTTLMPSALVEVPVTSNRPQSNRHDDAIIENVFGQKQTVYSVDYETSFEIFQASTALREKIKQRPPRVQIRKNWNYKRREMLQGNRPCATRNRKLLGPLSRRKSFVTSPEGLGPGSCEPAATSQPPTPPPNQVYDWRSDGFWERIKTNTQTKTIHCLVCAKQQDVGLSLLSDEVKALNLLDMLEGRLDIKVDVTLPLHICRTCVRTVILMQVFYERCRLHYGRYEATRQLCGSITPWSLQNFEAMSNARNHEAVLGHAQQPTPQNNEVTQSNHPDETVKTDTNDDLIVVKDEYEMPKITNVSSEYPERKDPQPVPDSDTKMHVETSNLAEQIDAHAQLIAKNVLPTHVPREDAHKTPTNHYNDDYVRDCTKMGVAEWAWIWFEVVVIILVSEDRICVVELVDDDVEIESWLD